MAAVSDTLRVQPVAQQYQIARWNPPYRIHGRSLRGDQTHGTALGGGHAFDAIVLAARLSGTDGLQVCRALRDQAGFQKAIMVVGPETGSTPTVAALRAGADDYRAPPLAFMEVHARLRALCRRNKAAPSVLRIGDLEYDPKSAEVRRQGRRLAPTPTGLKLLRVLVEAAPRVVSYAELEA